MYLEKFINSNTGKYMMSIILGLGLATFFRQICKGKRCKIMMGPKLDELEDKIYKFDNKCYKMEKSAMNCDNTKKVLSFA
jgi:hypothetical protein